MKYKELLAKLATQRAEKLALMQDLHTKAATETRTFDKDEQKTFADLEADIASIDAQIKSTEAMERLTAGQTVGVDGGGTSGGDGTPADKTDKGHGSVDVGDGRGLRVVRNLAKGTAFTRYAMALAASKGNLMQAAETAKGWANSTPEVERILKAAVAAGTTTDPVWAAPLVDYRTMSEEFIELLRPETILGQMSGIRRVPFNVRIPRMTAGASVSWVGEGAAKPVTRQSFDTVIMPSTKVAGIVVITMELARFSSPSAEQLVRDDMVEAIATFTNAQFINPAVAAVANTNPASITNGTTAVPSTGSTLAEIEADLLAARLVLVNAGLSLAGAYWVMNPATRMGLEELRTAQDVLAFPSLGTNGTLKGIPVITSTSVGQFDADGAGAGVAAPFIALVSAPNVLLADDGQVMLDSSSEASLSMTDDGAGTTMTSLWQRNMIGIRAERFIHWLRRRANSVVVITGVEY
jgi:HK97 family phage major capsid protein